MPGDIRVKVDGKLRPGTYSSVEEADRSTARLDPTKHDIRIIIPRRNQ